MAENIKWDTLQSTGVEDQTFLCLVQGNFLYIIYIRVYFRQKSIYT